MALVLGFAPTKGLVLFVGAQCGVPVQDHVNGERTLSSLLVDQNLPSAMTSHPDSLGEDNRPRGRGFFSVRCAWITGNSPETQPPISGTGCGFNLSTVCLL